MAKILITNWKVKTPTRSKNNNILTLYSPRSNYIERADTITIDTELILHAPKDSTAHLVTKNQNNCWSKNRKVVVNTTERILSSQIQNKTQGHNWISCYWARGPKNTLWKEKTR